MSMPFPHDLSELVGSLARLLPAMPEEDRKDYIQNVMELVFRMGVTEGKFWLLDRMHEAIKKEEKQEPPQSPAPASPLPSFGKKT